MITLPVGFDMDMFIGDILTIGLPIVGVGVSIFVYKIISYSLTVSDKK